MRIEGGRIINDFIEPNKYQYAIPVYQRNYEWSREQCIKLFEDIVLAYKRDRNHFCGSVVYAPLTEEHSIHYYVIVDGQQRLTTIYLLLKALLDCAQTESERDSLESVIFNRDKFDDFAIDTSSKLKLKPIKSDNQQLYLLMENQYDEIDKGSGIWINYTIFKNEIEQLMQSDPDISVKDIYRGVERLTCARIRLDDNDNAQEVFERINSTGLPLSLPDKIRNYVLMTENEQERLYEQYWLKTEQMLSKSQLSEFFLDYLNMKSDSFTREALAYDDFKKVYEQGSYTNESMLQEILHYAGQYHTFYHGDEQFNDKINHALAGLRQLKQSTVYLFLFHIFDDYEDGIIDQNELGKVLNMLLNYSIRRLICEVGSNSLRGLYKTLYSRVFNNVENKEHYYDAIVSFLRQLTSKDVIPDDTDFALSLKERNLYRKNALCKYLLIAIENQGKEKVDTDTLSIEHIMPQNKNLSSAWQRMLGEEWIAVKDRYLHTLGNLTLTGYNSELGDRPFAEKKELLEKAGSHITILYSDVKDKEVWNADAIEARAQRLTDIILKLYPIPEPDVKIEFTDPRYKEYTVADSANATYKVLNYYELLGERVVVDSFAQMMRSVATKFYEMDSSIIRQMARNTEKFPKWNKPVFAYEEKELRKPVKLRKDSNIYISTGYSAYDTVSFIRELMKKYELDIEEDFVYSARQSVMVEKEPERLEYAKQWCELQQKNGKVSFNPNNSSGSYVRFTTPCMSKLLPETAAQLSVWNTTNYYFYEIMNSKGELYIQLQLYCEHISDDMKKAFEHLTEITGKGKLNKIYKLIFRSSRIANTENDTQEVISSALNMLFAEVESFEKSVADKWESL